MAIPMKDSALAAWSTNFDTRINASAVTFGLSNPQASAYTPLHDGFIAALNAVNTVGARSKSLVAVKDAAKVSLLAYARELYGFVQSNTSVSVANKDLVGVTVKAAPTPQPPPDFAPVVDIISVVGRTVNVRLHDAETPSKRGRPFGVKGAAIFSFVGAEPPANPGSWRFEKNTSKTITSITFPDSVAPGAQVWVTAFWFSETAESGPAATPISTNVQFGVAMAA